MFSGWKLTNDIDILIRQKNGQFQFDLLAKTITIDNEPFNSEFHMLSEIAAWFDKDLLDNGIDRSLILSATLNVNFKAIVTGGKPKSKTKKIIYLKLDMTSQILTDEKQYSTEKTREMEYHYIDKNKDSKSTD